MHVTHVYGTLILMRVRQCFLQGISYTPRDHFKWFWHFSGPGLAQEAWQRRDNKQNNAQSIKLTRGEPSGDSSCSGVTGKLENGPLTVGPARDDEDVLRVLDGGDGSGGQHHLLPGLFQVDDVDSIIATLEDVRHHGRLRILRSDVDRGGQHLGDVALLKKKHN